MKLSSLKDINTQELATVLDVKMKLSSLKDINTQELATVLDVTGREALLEKFSSQGLPSKKSEQYRYFDVEKLLDKEYKTLKYVPKTISEGEKIEIVDGVVVSAPKGLRIYYEACERIDMEHFDPLYYLGHLLSPLTIKIEIDGDTELELVHRFTNWNLYTVLQHLMHLSLTELCFLTKPTVMPHSMKNL